MYFKKTLIMTAALTLLGCASFALAVLVAMVAEDPILGTVLMGLPLLLVGVMVAGALAHRPGRCNAKIRKTEYDRYRAGNGFAGLGRNNVGAGLAGVRGEHAASRQHEK